MNKHFIEKPSRPACFEIANILMIIVTLVILYFLGALFFFIFLVAAIVFCVWSIFDYKHMPEAILYTKDNSLYYYNKGLTRMKFKDIKSIKVSYDKKHKPYIDIFYTSDTGDKNVVIKHDNANYIVDGIIEIIEKTKGTKK